ncbi:MAG: phytanoyl-CoA dioxygenase family protein, partial [Gammaproteobacteria bacterium]
MNLDKHLNDIRVDGYTILEHLLPDASVAQIKQALSPYLQRKKMGRNDFEGLCSERVYALLAKAPEIAEIIEHPTILALVDEFLTPNYLLSAALAINVHPGETPQRFHSDDSAASPLLARPRPMVGVSTIWAFDDFTENNGATEVIPGSHLWDESVKP